MTAGVTVGVTQGIIIFAHGPRIEPANEAVRLAAADLARVGDYRIVEAAFLELGRPNLEEAADMLAARGVERIVIIPYFLTPGMHLERDLPALVDRIRKEHKNIEIRVTESLDGHPGLVQILSDRARAIESPPLK